MPSHRVYKIRYRHVCKNKIGKNTCGVENSGVQTDQFQRFSVSFRMQLSRIYIFDDRERDKKQHDLKVVYSREKEIHKQEGTQMMVMG